MPSVRVDLLHVYYFITYYYMCTSSERRKANGRSYFNQDMARSKWYMYRYGGEVFSLVISRFDGFTCMALTHPSYM